MSHQLPPHLSPDNVDWCMLLPLLLLRLPPLLLLLLLLLHRVEHRIVRGRVRLKSQR